MNDLIQTPAKGQPLRASWAASVSETVNRHERTLSSSAEPTPENHRSPTPPPHPFFVAGGEDQGSARFVIYLPAGCLVCGSTVLVPEAGLTALQGAADRYVIPAANLGQLGATATAAATLYVVAYRTSGTYSSVVADVTTNLSSVPSDATTLLALPVARIFAGAHGSGSYGCVAAQYVRSSVEITEPAVPATSADFNFLYKIRRIFGDVCALLRWTAYDNFALMVDGQYVSLPLDASYLRDNLAWHKVLTTSSAGTLFLNISKGTNGYSASFGSQADASAKWAIRIGTYPASNSDEAPRNYVMGALILNSGESSDSGSGGGSSGTTTTADVVTDVAYDEYTHKLSQTKKTLTVLDAADPNPATTPVFTASPHSAEHNS